MSVHKPDSNFRRHSAIAVLAARLKIDRPPLRLCSSTFGKVTSDLVGDFFRSEPRSREAMEKRTSVELIDLLSCRSMERLLNCSKAFIDAVFVEKIVAFPFRALRGIWGHDF